MAGSQCRCLALLAMLVAGNAVAGTANVSVRDDETAIALAVSPPAYWGFRIRREAQLRVLTLCLSGEGGGTSRCDWSEHLNARLRTSLAIPISVHDESLLLKGLSFNQLSQHKLSFEANSAEQWPNLVIVETSEQSDSTASYVHGIDHFFQSLRTKYSSQNLQPPDYLLIETPRTKELMEHARNADKSFSRVEVLWTFDKSKFRHQHLLDFARFYRHPLISMVDASLPSLLRHFLCEDCQGPWPYMDDNSRLTFDGINLLVTDILVPFFMIQLNKPISTDFSRTSLYDDPAIVYVP